MTTKVVARSGRPLPASVEVKLPPWLGGGNPAGAAAAARWRTTETAGGTWSLRLQERPGAPPRLVRSDLLGHAGNVDSPGTWARLAQLPPHAEHLGPGTAERIAAHLRSTPTDGSLTDVLARLVLTTQACSEQQLPEIVQDGLRLLLSLDALGQGQQVHLVQVDEALARRATLVRALAQLEQPGAASAMAQIAAQGGALPPDSPLAAARHLGSDLTFGFTAYLGPLLLAASPYVWASCVPRGGVRMLVLMATRRRCRVRG